MTGRVQPIVIFGIDGATHTVLDPLLAQGHLPQLQRLKERGAWGVLRSTIHPLTPAAWVSMVTGLNPGKHGVYDFRRRQEGSYAWELVNSRSWSGEALWSIFSQQGWRVGVVNVPMTYPPQPVNGFMVSGMGAPRQLQGSVYPAQLAALLQERFPDYAVDPEVEHISHAQQYLAQYVAWVERRIAVLRLLREEYPELDFLMVVFTEIDRIQHVFWRFLDASFPDYHTPEAGDVRAQVTGMFRQIDGALGELWEWVAERGGHLLVVSDHGFGPLLKDVYINKWLVDHGYLALKPDVGVGASGNFFEQVDWEHTRAYSFGFFGNISLNLHGREPRGIVEPGRQAEQLKQEIAQRLSELTDPESGERVVDAVYRREQLYSGLYVEQAPDLLVVMRDYAYMTRDGFDFISERLMGPPMEYQRSALPHSGNHRLEGIVLLAGDGVCPGAAIGPAEIVDIAPTVLHLASLPLPADVDGRVLVEAFEADFLGARQVAYRASAPPAQVVRNPFRRQLLEKEAQIVLLNQEIDRLRHDLAEREYTIRAQQAVIERFKAGRVMRLLAWLHRMRQQIGRIRH